jgi:hypothetical protein
MTARDVLAAVRTFGDAATLPNGAATAPIYDLVDRAEAVAMEPLAGVTIRELATKGNPAPAPGKPPA